MGIVLVLLSFVVAVAALLGLIRGRVWFLRSRKQALVGLVVGFAMFVVGGAMLQPSTETPARAQAAPAAEGASIETKRADFAAWFEKVSGIQNGADEALAEYQKTATDLSNGTIGLADAYLSVKAIRDRQVTAQAAMRTIAVPSSLSKADQAALKEASSDLATGLYSRQAAMEKVMGYLDEQKPSLIAGAQEDLAAANAFVVKGLAAVFKVQAALGLETPATP